MHCDTVLLPPCPNASGHYWTGSGQDRATAAHAERNRVWGTMKCVTAATSRQCHTSSTPCHLTKLDVGLQRLHTTDEAAVNWLTSYGT